MAATEVSAPLEPDAGGRTAGRDRDVPPPLQGTPLVIMTIAIAMATFMEILDITIVNVSVPSIAGSMGVSPNEATWTISSYSLAAAIMQPMTGWLGRRFGEVRMFVVCISLFVICSALCGLSNSMTMLIIGRLLQGAVSGPMVPMAQALLMRNYAPEKRGMAMGIWAMVVFVAPIFGPIIGGWITDNYSWPWIFFINVPIGGMAALAIWGILRKRDSKRVQVPVDVIGLCLLVVGIGALQFVLDNGNDKDWFNSGTIIAGAAVAVIGIAFLVGWELTDKHPIIDLTLFRLRNFRTGVIAMVFGYCGFFGATVIFPLWLQTTLGYTATWAGLATAPVGVLGLLLMPLIGSNLNRMNLRIAVTASFLVFGFTMQWVATLNQDASFWQLIAPRFWQGFGMALFFVPLNTILLSEIRPDDIASASGLSNFLRTLGGSLSTAICIWLWTVRGQYHGAMLSEHVQGANWQIYSGHLQAYGLAGVSALGHTANLVAQQARTLAANDVYRVIGYMFFLLAPVIWLTKPPFRAAGGGGAH